MKTALVVLAHPSAASFNHAWFVSSLSALRNAGYEILTSDLFALGFDPAERAEHYGDLVSVNGFDVLRVQSDAQQAGMLPEAVKQEIGKLHAADLVVFHFPLWWFSPPAMLKGWFERVLVHGEFHTSEKRFDKGLASGKRALFCVTCGVDENGGAPSGFEADTRMLLWPLAFSLYYCGFDVFQPIIQYGVHGFHEGQAKAELEAALDKRLAGQQQLIENLEMRQLIRFNPQSDFDENGLLKQDAPVYSKFISRENG